MNNVEIQRDYYETNMNKPAMQPSNSIYVQRHINRVIDAASLTPKKELLEIGSGLGKFTIPLIERGYTMSCLDISQLMLDSVSNAVLPNKITTIKSDIAEVDKHTDLRFDQVIGFFTLHHMSDLKKSFEGLDKILRPGATAVFCEPRAFNPLYYLQIAITPRMSWSAEKGIVNMREKVIKSAISSSNLELVNTESYGFFPPFIMNKPLGNRLNDRLESWEWLSFGHAFQIYIFKKI